MMKKMLILLNSMVAVLMLGCTEQPPPSGVPLAAQSTPAPFYSPLDEPSLLPASHQHYRKQHNALEGAAYGGMIGAGVGQLGGGNTESTIVGSAAGALIGYGAYH